MKYIITERQLNLIKEDEHKILKLDFEVFNKNWNILQKFLERRGNPPYIITGDLSLVNIKIESLGNLKSVGGYLDLIFSNIESLGDLQSVGGSLNLHGAKVKSLGDLQSVGSFLDLRDSKIKSLGNLKFVGSDFGLENTPLSKTTTEEEIRSQVEVGGEIYM